MTCMRKLRDFINKNGREANVERLLLRGSQAMKRWLDLAAETVFDTLIT